jgi:hypothetical protein
VFLAMKIPSTWADNDEESRAELSECYA